jgi:lysophospholipase L1-like esterase
MNRRRFLSYAIQSAWLLSALPGCQTVLVDDNPDLTGYARPVLPADLSDNGYSAERTNYYEASPYSRLIVNTDAARVWVKFYVLGTLYTDFPNMCKVGVWDGSTYQEIAAAGTGNNWGGVDLAAGSKTVQIVTGATSRPNEAGNVQGIFLNAVYFSGGQSVEYTTSKPAERILVYGDSIAAGFEATRPTNESWVMKLRQAYSGSVMVEAWGWRSLHGDGVDGPSRQTFANRVAGYGPSIVWLAIGVNDHGLNLWTAANFGTAYADLLDKLHAALPSAAIYAQTPIVQQFERANGLGGTLGNYRTQISNAQSTRSAWCTLSDGSAYLTTGDLNAVGVHPTTVGHNKYYLALKAALGL